MSRQTIYRLGEALFTSFLNSAHFSLAMEEILPTEKLLILSIPFLLSILISAQKIKALQPMPKRTQMKLQLFNLVSILIAGFILRLYNPQKDFLDVNTKTLFAYGEFVFVFFSCNYIEVIFAFLIARLRRLNNKRLSLSGDLTHQEEKIKVILTIVFFTSFVILYYLFNLLNRTSH